MGDANCGAKVGQKNSANPKESALRVFAPLAGSKLAAAA